MTNPDSPSSQPFSQACENNKQPILSVIRRHFRDGITVLEIGSYTTQHVRFFAQQMADVTWQPSDTPDSMGIVEAGLADENSGNILAPVPLDVCDDPWQVSNVGGIFSANCLHIMSADHLPCFFRGAGSVLESSGFLCVYGPFNYGGEFSSESNARFEGWLRGRDPLSGIRDFETVDALANENGMTLVEDNPMPANNQLLVWQKTR